MAKKVKEKKMPKNRLMDAQNVAHSFNEVLLYRESELNISNTDDAWKPHAN